MDTPKIHHDPDTDPHPHACVDGLIYMGYTVYDAEIGDEVERLEVVPCRRCAERAGAMMVRNLDDGEER